MNKSTILLLPVLLLVMALLAGCPTVKADGGGTTVDPFAGIQKREMATVNTVNNYSMGYTGVATPVHTVAKISAFTMGKYEVTYELWKKVYDWAKVNGYSFSKDTASTTTGVCGSSGNGSTLQPVTTISWRDCMVWCNAYSQMSDLQPVYCTGAGYTTPLKTCDAVAVSATTVIAGNEDNPFVNWGATGYRLPTEAEWEECARYVNSTTYNPGDYMSGATADYTNDSASFAVAVFGY